MKTKLSARSIGAIVALVLLAVCCVGMPVFAWLSMTKTLAVYAPVSSPEALYIGAGHCEEDRFEDIRYLYFDGINANAETYRDRVFCVYGKSVSGYRIQLAYTTNNQFSYAIYHATESTTPSEGAIPYETHSSEPTVYYYKATGDALVGNYLNKTVVGEEILADSTKHAATYGSYAAVQTNAEPIYWQTRDVEVGNARDSFVNYYVIRLYTEGKTANDRETDVLCIAAKSFST